jgi:hypothetical protein
MDVPKSLLKIVLLLALVILVGCTPRQAVPPTNQQSQTGASATEHTPAMAKASPQSQTVTLASKSLLPNFLGGAPARTQEAYQFAIAYPHELEKYPCYCGCASMGHKDNLDCYIKDIDETGKITFDNHAAGCAICADITQDVMRLMGEGLSSKEIRTYIDDQYRSSGPSTNTPLPVD